MIWSHINYKQFCFVLITVKQQIHLTIRKTTTRTVDKQSINNPTQVCQMDRVLVMACRTMLEHSHGLSCFWLSPMGFTAKPLRSIWVQVPSYIICQNLLLNFFINSKLSMFTSSNNFPFCDDYNNFNHTIHWFQHWIVLSLSISFRDVLYTEFTLNSEDQFQSTPLKKLCDDHCWTGANWAPIGLWTGAN